MDPRGWRASRMGRRRPKRSARLPQIRASDNLLDQRSKKPTQGIRINRVWIRPRRLRQRRSSRRSNSSRGLKVAPRWQASQATSMRWMEEWDTIAPRPSLSTSTSPRSKDIVSYLINLKFNLSNNMKNRIEKIFHRSSKTEESKVDKNTSGGSSSGINRKNIQIETDKSIFSLDNEFVPISKK